MEEEEEAAAVGGGGGGGGVKCGMHNVKGVGLATICPTTVGSEAGSLPTDNFLFSSTAVEMPAAPAASALGLLSSSLLPFLSISFLPSSGGAGEVVANRHELRLH